MEDTDAVRLQLARDNAKLREVNAELVGALQSLISWMPGRSAWHTDEPVMDTERAKAVLAKAKQS